MAIANSQNWASWRDSLDGDPAVVVDTIMAHVYAVNDSQVNAAPGYNEVDGLNYYWRPSNTTFIYDGYIYLEQGKRYYFGKAIDDSGQVKILPYSNRSIYDSSSGCSLPINQNGHNQYVTGSYEHTRTNGWYAFQVRVGDGSGGKGPMSQVYSGTNLLQVANLWGAATGMVWSYKDLAYNENTGRIEALPEEVHDIKHDPENGGLRFRTSNKLMAKVVSTVAGAGKYLVRVKMSDKATGDVTVFLNESPRRLCKYDDYIDGEWSGSGTRRMERGDEAVFEVPWTGDSVPYCSVYVVAGEDYSDVTGESDDGLEYFTEFGVPERCTSPYFAEKPHVEVNGRDRFNLYGYFRAGTGSVHSVYTTYTGSVTNWVADMVASWDSATDNLFSEIGIAGLSPNASYQYAVTVWDEDGKELAVESNADGTCFYNGPLTVAKVSDGEPDGSVPGVFRISRADTADGTFCPLTVNYRLGGDAVPGVDYDATELSGTLTLESGVAYADVVIPPIVGGARSGTTVTLTVAEGLYLPDIAAKATLKLYKEQSHVPGPGHWIFIR